MMNDEDIKRLLGDDEDYHRRRKLADERSVDYMTAHPHEWLAVAEGDVWMLADSLKALLDALDARGLSRDSAVIRYLHPNPPTLKL